MCDIDRASDTEFLERAAHIAVARITPPTSPIARKRAKLTEARMLAAQRGPNDPDVQELGLDCENCGEQLPIDAEDVFCCKECADDWEARERVQRIAGTR